MRMKPISKLLFITVGIAVFTSSCKHEPILDTPTGGNVGGGVTNPTNGICFESQILPIFQSSCAYAGCHDAITSADGFNFSSYASIMATNSAIKPNNPGDSKVIRFITEDDPDKIMPPPPKTPLSSDQINLLIQWINEGAQNTTNCSQSCDTTQFKFAADILPIFQSHCNGCHSGASPSAGINLTNHSGAATVANNGRLWGSITHTSGYSAMPQNSPKLNDCKTVKIKKWIDNGAPNN